MIVPPRNPRRDSLHIDPETVPTSKIQTSFRRALLWVANLLYLSPRLANT